MLKPNRSLKGSNGGPHHQDLIDAIRFDAREHLNKLDPYWVGYCISDRALMAALFEKKFKRGTKIADVVFIGSSGVVPVEVGRMQADKWGKSQPVVHVGFDGGVSVINGTGHPFEKALVKAIEKTMTGLRVEYEADMMAPE